MSSSMRMLTVLLALSVFAAVPCVFAEDAVKPAEAKEVVAPAVVELTGTVSATKDEIGLVTSAVLKVGEGEKAESIAIKLDMNGRKLARTAPADKAVKVSGTVAEVDGKKMVTVQKFDLVQEEPKKTGE